jgi:hypothetical protein
LLLGAGVALAAPPSASWSVTRQPTSVAMATPTQVAVTVTNLSPSDQIGCIVLSVPSPAFGVSSTAVLAQPAPARVWATSYVPGAPTTVVTAQATNGGSTLRGGTIRDTVVIGVTVSGAIPGTHTWTAGAFSDPACTPQKSLPLNASFTIRVTILPTPVPPTPKVTATPRVTPTPNVTPTPAPTPTTAPTNSVEPTAAPTPDQSGRPLEPHSESPAPSPTGLATASDEPAAIQLGRAGGEPGEAEPVGGIGNAAIAALDELPGGVLAFSVPALVVSLPGLLVLLAIGAQAIGALAWLPLVRRRLGGFGVRRR